MSNPIWERTDGHSNGRWLYVDHPDREGDIEVGIVGVYRKHLTPAEAKAMAKALRQAAREGRRAKAAATEERDRQTEAKRRCMEELGGHDWGDWAAGDFSCRRCGAAPPTSGHANSMVVTDIGEFARQAYREYERTSGIIRSDEDGLPVGSAPTPSQTDNP